MYSWIGKIRHRLILHAFYTMTNGRGVLLEMVSGNGTNFVGPNIESKEVVEALDTKEINRSGSEKGIRWHFSTGVPFWWCSGELNLIFKESSKSNIEQYIYYWWRLNDSIYGSYKPTELQNTNIPGGESRRWCLNSILVKILKLLNKDIWPTSSFFQRIFLLWNISFIFEKQ